MTGPTQFRHVACALLLTSCFAGSTLGQQLWQSSSAHSIASEELTTTARAAEIAVELAWLADARVYAYPLQARWSGGLLVLQGQVPNQTIRQAANGIARASTSHPISDQIAVNPRIMLAFPQDPTASFAEEAKSRLFSLGPVEGKLIELKATKDGKLFVSGYVASDEERLAYSRVFRGLVGCKLVRNEMTVGTTPSSTEMDSLPQRSEVTAHSQHVLPRLGAPQIVHGVRNKDGTELPRLFDETKMSGGQPAKISFEAP